jgi:quercetin dioxygenase-like cupin family protein
MMQTTIISYGIINGSVYDFPKVDDVLPMHTHTEADVHISIVAKGSFKAHGDGWERVLVSGNVVDWPANYPHEFIALEPDSRLVNIRKS